MVKFINASTDTGSELWVYFFHRSLFYIHVPYKNPLNLNQYTVITEHISTNSRETAPVTKKIGARKARVTTDTTAKE